LLLTLVAALPSQAPPVGDGTEEGLPAGRVILDETLAVVGGRLVWRSSVQEEYDAAVSGIEINDVTLSEQEKRGIWTSMLGGMIQKGMLAHGATTLGFATPEEVQRYVDNIAQEKEKALIRDFGGRIEVVEELKSRGQTWAEYKALALEDELSSLALSQSVAQRLHGLAPLFVTKKEMREYYGQNTEIWVHGPVATLEVVAFSESNGLSGNGLSGNGLSGNGLSGDGASAASRAMAASQGWGDGISAQELADRFGGLVHRGNWRFSSEETADARLPFYREFALGHQRGEVSPPMEQPNGSYRILRVASREEGIDLGFENREVQAMIQNILLDRVISNLQGQTLLRSRSRTYVWPPELRGR
jgi:hypothetical protein